MRSNGRDGTPAGASLTITLIEADRPCSECRAAQKTLAAICEAFEGRVALRVLHRSDAEAQAYGVVMTPVVVVGDVVFSMGRRPPVGRLEAYVRERLDEHVAE